MPTKCKYIDGYFDELQSGRVPASKNMLLAIGYINRKLDNPDVFIDNDKIEIAIELIERYFKMTLMPWELLVLALVHCYYRSTDMVVFDEFFIMMGRGNGKNGFISGLAWYLTTHYHGIAGYNVDIIANSEDQATESFNDIYEMLESTWEKSKRFFYKSKEIIRNLKTRSYIKYNTSNARTKDGKRSACLIFDEVHEYENAKMIGVFTSGFGKRKHGRVFKITTNGYVREGVLDDDLRLAADVLNGTVTQLGLCPLIYMMDDDAECDDPALWEKANPSLPYFPELRKTIEQAYLKKPYDKQTELEFYTKRMNRPRTAEELPVTEWDNIAATNIPLPDLTGRECVVGVDYAEVKDWVGVNLHFRDGEIRYDINHAWLCLRSPDLSRIKAPWGLWADAGLITPVDDVEIAPELVCEWIFAQGQKYQIKGLALDNFRYSRFKEALAKIGYDAADRKNIKLVRPSDIMQVVPVVDGLFNRRLFAWGDNPVLRWSANNTKLIKSGVRSGEYTGNMVYGKIEPKSRKNDPFQALYHSVVIEDLLSAGSAAYVDLPVIVC